MMEGYVRSVTADCQVLTLATFGRPEATVHVCGERHSSRS